MKTFTARQLAFIWFLANKNNFFTKATTPWLPTSYRNDRFTNLGALPSSTCSSMQCAGVKCDANIDCSLFCEETETKTFSLWQIVVDPFVEESNGPLKKCWTRGLRGNFNPLLNGVSLFATPTRSVFPHRVKENLLERFFPYNDFWYESDVADYPYLLIDLGQMVKIRAVTLLAKGTVRGNLVGDFEKLSIKVGTEQKLGDFSSYKEIGYFAGPGYTLDVASFEVNPPITGRYVSIQLMKPIRKIALAYFNIYIQ